MCEGMEQGVIIGSYSQQAGINLVAGHALGRANTFLALALMFADGYFRHKSRR